MLNWIFISHLSPIFYTLKFLYQNKSKSITIKTYFFLPILPKFGNNFTFLPKQFQRFKPTATSHQHFSEYWLECYRKWEIPLLEVQDQIEKKSILRGNHQKRSDKFKHFHYLSAKTESYLRATIIYFPREMLLKAWNWALRHISRW